ncbi:uncharacterized protein LOC120183123 [Hibiscus syriacus]|uniref:uncharacterized protein LOC120183123 n=1 Tax=Hibiscus syriacus TaxID=106335 RepID=UPI0019237E45|nr:uncharacterized protein LOC120183123 [Hibiscus syriacus]
MDDKIAQIEKTQAEMQENLKKAQEDMREQMMKAQDDMMAKLISLLQGNSIIREETPIISHTAEEPLYPPGFTPPHFHAQQTTTIQPKKYKKMTGYVGNDQLLIHCFQESLAGSAIRWYNQLSRANIKSWKDLAKAFLEQYKHVKDVRPNRILLQSMEKRSNESFRQYAQRWRDVAVQVYPPLEEEETNMFFVNTLRAPFFGHLIGNSSKNFADIVNAGEMIEMAIKSGKLDGENLAESLQQEGRIMREQPNVAQNPLPNHAGTGVNAVIEEKGNEIITKVKK